MILISDLNTRSSIHVVCLSFLLYSSMQIHSSLIFFALETAAFWLLISLRAICRQKLSVCDLELEALFLWFDVNVNRYELFASDSRNKLTDSLLPTSLLRRCSSHVFQGRAWSNAVMRSEAQSSKSNESGSESEQELEPEDKDSSREIEKAENLLLQITRC